MPEGLAPAYKPLFELAGPVIRYRILRDLAHRDDSFLETLGLRQEVEKLPFVRAILPQRKADGSWGELADSSNLTGAEEVILTLCELGLADHEAVSQYAETSLLPQLSQENSDSNAEDLGSALPCGTTAAPHSRGLVGDRLLRLLVRAGFGERPRVRQMMSDVIEEWKNFVRRATSEELFVKQHGVMQPREGITLPTSAAYDAICFHNWQENDEETVAESVVNLFAWSEKNPWPEESRREHLFRLRSKQEYLARPEQMLYEIELSARLGIVQKCAATRWMLEELEARQDGDGFFRFDSEGASSLPWYFPLEKEATSDDFTVEWTFRGLLIFSLLGYDV